jgi:hypothetical protein
VINQDSSNKPISDSNAYSGKLKVEVIYPKVPNDFPLKWKKLSYFL